MSGGHIALLFFGLVLAGMGAFILWTGTAGAEWNRAHKRSLQKSPTPGQHQFAIISACLGGSLVILAGLGMIISAFS